jgi:ATP-dependent Clp protease, protease subunit
MRNRLLQLLAENRKPFEPVSNKIVAKGNHAGIYLYDPIVGDRVTAEWWGGICPQDFVPALRALEADSITLYTNCPGGDVFAAEAMCQALREHPAKVTMQIEGYAASAATAIACACDEVIATAASKYMIHQTWTLAIGNADELLQTVDLLRKCDDSMYDAYERRTGQSRDQIIEWCKAETWFTAEEAVKFGFVDSVLTASSPSASAGRRWNLSAYANAPAPAQEPARAQEPAPLIALATEDHRVRQQQRIAMLARLQVS